MGEDEKKARRAELLLRGKLGEEGLKVELPVQPRPAPVLEEPVPPVPPQVDVEMSAESGEKRASLSPLGEGAEDKKQKLSESEAMVGALCVCAVRGDLPWEDEGESEVCVASVGPLEESWKIDVLPSSKPVYGHKSGEELSREGVREAREREIKLMTDHGMFEYIEEYKVKGKIVKAGWLDDHGKSGIRSRLVAKEYNTFKREDVVQNTPPLSIVRLFVSKAATATNQEGRHTKCIAVWDCSVAFFHASITEPIYVRPGDGLAPRGWVWKLRRAMNGTRPASKAFGDLVRQHVKEYGLRAVPSAAMVFHDEDRDVSLLVHGDDFFCVAERRDIEEFGALLENRFRINLIGLIGPGCKDKELKILKRTVSFQEHVGYTWVNDAKHVEELLENMSLTGCKPTLTPGTKDTVKNLPDAEDELDEKDAKFFQSCAGKLMYHSLDDPRVQFETGMVMSGMEKPRVMDKARLWRVVRYLAGVPRVEWRFPFQKGDVSMYVLCDADHASDEETRRSTSSTQSFVGRHLISTDSVKQQVIALSSGEAEFYAIRLGAAEGLFLWQVIEAIGFGGSFKKKKPTIYSDSSAARGACLRSGAGRLKHIQTRFLWTQEAIASGRMDIECIDTELNTSDIGTKYLEASKRSKILAMLPLTQKGLGSAIMVAMVLATLPLAKGEFIEMTKGVMVVTYPLEEARGEGSVWLVVLGVLALIFYFIWVL